MVVLVAGGIGITPGIGIAAHIVNQAVAGVAFNTSGWHIHILWIVKHSSHITWFETELKSLAMIASNSAIPVTLDITIHVTSDGGEEADSVKFEGLGDIYRGRPDITKWFESIRDLRAGMDASVNLCGPAQLVHNARIGASKMSCVDILFHVEEEIFEF